MGQKKIENLWFEGLQLKRCPGCRKDTRGTVIGWYYYACGKKRLYVHFCENCFDPEVRYWVNKEYSAQKENLVPKKDFVVNTRFCPGYVYVLEERTHAQQTYFRAGYKAAQENLLFGLSPVSEESDSIRAYARGYLKGKPELVSQTWAIGSQLAKEILEGQN